MTQKDNESYTYTIQTVVAYAKIRPYLLDNPSQNQSHAKYQHICQKRVVRSCKPETDTYSSCT